MQPEVEENIKNCHTCQISTHKPVREPSKMSPQPAAPWAEVSADFGHLQNRKYLLVVTDEYSRYVVVDILDSISITSVIPRLDKIFAEFGVPVSLKTDNGPPFNSHEFKTYASITGFRLRRIIPLCPLANAETERFMLTVKKVHQNCPKQRWKLEAGIIQIPAGLPDNTTLNHNLIWPDHDHTHSWIP